MFKDTNLNIVLQPHLKKVKAGGVEALGIEVQRVSDKTSTLWSREAQARSRFYQLAGKVPVGSDGTF